MLANIYLHELDEYMEQTKQAFDQGTRRKAGTAWSKVTSLLRDHRQRIKALKGDPHPEAGVLIASHAQTIRELGKKQRSLPASDPLDPHYRRLFYSRYADDFLIGIIGSKHEAEVLFSEVKHFLNDHLKLAIAEEKSGIHHAKDGVPFLGYVVQNSTSDKLVKIHREEFTKVVALRRTMRDRIQLRIPQQKMREFCQRKGYGDYDTHKPSPRAHWMHADDLEILLAYNAEMRGLANYYALASDARTGLQRLMLMAKYSFLATLACKHASTTRQMYAQYRQGNRVTVTAKVEKGKDRTYTLFALKDWKPPQGRGYEKIDVQGSLHYLRLGRTTLEQRLKAEQCEYCERAQGYFEVHHVRKMKDLQGKQPWEQVMIARQRKTLVLCIECHDLLHAGKLSNRRKKD